MRDDAPISQLRSLAGAAAPPSARARILAPRPRPRALRLLVAAAAAGAAALVAAVWLDARPAPLPVGAAIAGPVETPAGRHVLEPGPGSHVVVEEDGASVTRLRLDGHSARFAIARLPDGKRLVVRAGGLEVEVIGTRFTVERDGACERVAVEEGRVRARAGGVERELGPGGSYGTCPEALPGEALVREALAALASGGDAGHAEARLLRYLERHPGGDFEEEARFHLFSIAAAAGRDDDARARAEAFLRRFPDADRAARARAWLEAQP